MSKHNAYSTQEIYYLTKVSYNEPKAEMLVEFSNKNHKVVQRHRFFPFTTFSGIGQDKLSELVLSLGFKGFSVEEKGGLVHLRALSFSNLKKISNALALHINKLPLALEPERAFLIEKNWAYFDSFEKLGEEFYKVGEGTCSPTEQISTNSQGICRVKDLGFFLTKEIPFSEALKVNESDALFLVEQSAWSSVLRVPLEKVPKEIGERVELFLENAFFRHGEALAFEKNDKVFSSMDYDPLSRDSTSKLDFSYVWAELFSNNFFNIGPETKNCACCTPITLESKNLLPSSLIKVRFAEDNLFFESSSGSFAFDYHNTNPAKEQRASKRKEFFLNSFPLGPFFKDSVEFVPLMDARRLVSENKAVLVSSKTEVSVENNSQAQDNSHELNWFCLKNESFFSKEVRALNSEMFEVRKLVDSFESSLFHSTFEYYYFKFYFSALSNVLCALPKQLTSTNSKFFSTQLAKSIVSIQEATIAKFREFSEKEGYRVLHAGKNFASVKGFSSLKLAKDFAKESNLPQPQIAGFTAKAKRKF
ncbi:Uncharacterised protein [uncultured archaeon]|nr:Uncharacterised protein [uncultured archaeon]